MSGVRGLTEDPFSDASGDAGATREAPRGHSADYHTIGSHTASSDKGANRERTYLWRADGTGLMAHGRLARIEGGRVVRAITATL